MDDQHLSIFDLPGLGESEAWSAVRKTIAAHRFLEEIFDDTFIARLIRRRSSPDGYLLFWLVQPTSEVVNTFWSTVGDELAKLEQSGVPAIASFRPKMRRLGCAEFQSWRTELWFAARIRHSGIAIDLEPSVGTRLAEFMADTEPPTVWEIKSPLDLPDLRLEEHVLLEIQSRLRRIPERYVLQLTSHDVEPDAIGRAVRNLRHQMRAATSLSRQVPFEVSSEGIVLRVSAISRREYGYLAVLESGLHVLGNEHERLVVRRLLDAADQLPVDQAGVIVIDRTNAEWLGEEAVVAACFGEESYARINGRWMDVRGVGVFRPESGTRISAVVSYSRTWPAEGREYDLLFLHNPYARRPLPQELFVWDDARHMRRREIGGGRFELAF